MSDNYEARRLQLMTEMATFLDTYAASAPRGKHGEIPALVWTAHNAPECFGHYEVYTADDHDYVAATPPDSYHRWCEESGAFGCCDVEEIELSNGWTIHVGYHG